MKTLTQAINETVNSKVSYKQDADMGPAEVINFVAGTQFVLVNSMPTHASAERLGKLVATFEETNDHFKLEHFAEYIAGGMFGKVYDLGDGMILKVNTHQNTQARDGQIMHSLQGLPMIPKLYCYSTDNRYMVVQLIDGDTVSGFTHGRGFMLNQPFDEKQADLYCETLFDEAKSAGWFVNDIHNENVMIDKDGRLWVVDVGLFLNKHHYSNRAELGDMEELYLQVHLVKSKMDRSRF